MRILAPLSAIFGIMGSIATIWWNLYARRKYMAVEKKENPVLKFLRVSLLAVVMIVLIAAVIAFAAIIIGSIASMS